MEALRNHVQHRDLPIRRISYQNKMVEGSEVNCTEVMVVPEIEVEALINDGEFKKSVLDELQKMGDEIDLRLGIREVCYVALVLYKKMREVVSLRLKQELDIYISAIEKFSVLNGENADSPKLAVESDGGALMNEVWLGRTFVDYCKTLEKKNSSVREVATLFASNNAHERK